jgi:hypothetical protein
MTVAGARDRDFDTSPMLVFWETTRACLLVSRGPPSPPTALIPKNSNGPGPGISAPFETS